MKRVVFFNSDLNNINCLKGLNTLHKGTKVKVFNKDKEQVIEHAEHLDVRQFKCKNPITRIATELGIEIGKIRKKDATEFILIGSAEDYEEIIEPYLEQGYTIVIISHLRFLIPLKRISTTKTNNKHKLPTELSEAAINYGNRYSYSDYAKMLQSPTTRYSTLKHLDGSIVSSLL